MPGKETKEMGEPERVLCLRGQSRNKTVGGEIKSYSILGHRRRTRLKMNKARAVSVNTQTQGETF